MNTDERSKDEKIEENSQDESTIKSAKVHIGATVESTQDESSPGVESMELPLRLLVLGDFTPESPDPSDWSESSHLVSVDKNSFQSVMQQLSPRLSLDVPNRLSESPKKLTIQLHFPDMNAFRPEGIVQQVDVLANLLKIRGWVNQLNNRQLTFQEFEERLEGIGMESAWLEQFHQLLRPAQPGRPASPQLDRTPEATPTRVAEPKGDTLDSLLDMVNIGAQEAAPTSSPGQRTTAEPGFVDNLVRAIVQPKEAGPKPASSTAEAVIQQLDQMLSEQVNDILHHSKFQQLESTWRGLKFLIDRTNFRENIQVDLLSAHKENIGDAIYHQVFTPEYNELTETPLSVMIGDYEFNRAPEDTECLGNIAKMSASMQVPFIASVGPAFFGVETAEEQAKVALLRALFQELEYAKWQALREDEASQFIALTTPRFLLRFPYSPNENPVKGFDFTERTESSTDYLWGRGGFALATTLVRSFIQRGWCTQISGQRGGGIVENIPLWRYRAAGREVSIPIDVLYPQRKELEFVEAGLVLLSCRINSDAAFVLSAPSVHRPKRYSNPEETKEAQLHATLPYQLFATHIAHHLRRSVRDISTGLNPEQVQEILTARFKAILTKTGEKLSEESVIVEVEDSEGKPEYYNVFLRVQPPFRILGRNADLLLGLELHR